MLYGVYAITVFAVLGLLALLAVLILPGVTLRRRTASACSRAFFRVAGIRLVIKRPENIPAGQCVVVANHASYLDGPVFFATLPPRFGFVIKREMDRVPLAGLLLRRIGSEFVERFNRQRGASDARRVLRNAVSGHSLVFFPEGTFNPEPGLMKFHTGAFATAARAGCPVVPAVVRGTRDALPSGALLPRHAVIEIEFLPPVTADAVSAESAAAELRDKARAAILGTLQEPDLATACA